MKKMTTKFSLIVVLFAFLITPYSYSKERSVSFQGTALLIQNASHHDAVIVFLDCTMNQILNMKLGDRRATTWTETYRIELSSENRVVAIRLTVNQKLEGWDGVMEGSATETAIIAERVYSVEGIAGTYIENIELDRLVGSILREYVAVDDSKLVESHFLYKGTCRPTARKF